MAGTAYVDPMIDVLRRFFDDPMNDTFPSDPPT